MYDNIQLLMYSMQTAKTMGRSAVIVFVDLEKAYDHIDCTKLMHALQIKLAIPDNILYAMWNMYIEVRFRVV